MASILKIGDSWRAQTPRKGHKPLTGTFPNKASAVKWARQIEADMDARRFKDARGLTNFTLEELIIRYEEEIGAEKPFGKNKRAALAIWKKNEGSRTLDEITDDFLTTFVRNRRKGGVSGVTIAVDLSYLAGVKAR